MSQLRRLLPSLNTLVAFEAAVRCGTFARAARELGVTGPAVSRTIGRLELHLGMRLFRRTPSGVELTKDGDDLFSGVSQSFSDIERTVVRLKNKKRRRAIVLSVSSAFATHWFMPRLSEFQAHFPGEEIRFELMSGPLGGSVESADIAMRFDHKAEAHHKVRVLMPELLLPIRAPDLQDEVSTMGTLLPAANRIITLSEAQPDWASLFAQTLPAPNEVVFSDYTLVVQAALVGQGIALGWLNVVSRLLAQGKLVPASSSVTRTNRRCELVTRHGSGQRVIDQICDWMQAEFERDFAAIKNRFSTLEMPDGSLQ
jgi:LysR family glycine cleavage system transcriptional activator